LINLILHPYHERVLFLCPFSGGEQMQAPILNRFFKSRDKPITNYIPGSVYEFFFGSTSSGKTVNESVNATLKLYHIPVKK
jgi:hypothetical protein